jgi:integrase
VSVYKTDKSPYWQYDFQRKKQRFHGSTGCTSKRDAEAFEARLKREVALGHEAKRPITLDAACQAYWKDKGQHESSSTTTDYQLANLCEGIGANRLLSSIGTEDFRRYIAKRRATVSNASVNREWQLARRVWKHAAAAGYDLPIPGTPDAIDWSKLRLDEPKERVRELTADEEKRLFEKLPESLKPVVEFAALSGQRRSAVIGLLWDKVDLSGPRATIGLKGGGEHTFPLTPRLVEIIEAQPVVEDCPFVFTYACERPALSVQQAGLDAQVAQGPCRRQDHQLPLPRSEAHAGDAHPPQHRQPQDRPEAPGTYGHRHNSPLRARTGGRYPRRDACRRIPE